MTDNAKIRRLSQILYSRVGAVHIDNATGKIIEIDVDEIERELLLEVPHQPDTDPGVRLSSFVKSLADCARKYPSEKDEDRRSEMCRIAEGSWCGIKSYVD